MKIGIAFGSGGSRGIAHILMVETFEELGLKASVVSGSSIGAIAAAFYAAGFDSKEMREILDELIHPKSDSIFDFLLRSDVIKLLTMFDPQIIKSGLIKGEKFQKFLSDRIPARTFKELKIPCYITATDFWSRKEIVFNSGELIPAIKASYSIPGLFTPVEYQGKVLIDGGAVNPLPYDLIKNKCDITVAIDVTASNNTDNKELPATLDSVFSTFQIMQISIIREKLKHIKPDIYIKPVIKDIRLFDFAKTDLIFSQAVKAKDKLKRELENHLNKK
ncbi:MULTISPECIES: patatin-like phospholipase family protein [Ignavibacterium]|jgi:NTE family protein|uniref:patatin-like phospholipase family protein n=1 Tax=Ignavibacterium TaxID=795750 RepID=UPI0025BA20DA|nr:MULTISPECIES: patatin-like phospholipase family protein [Ignavibacterium]MBI5662077.1 patatin-like phospholipase family protein [Ignavibacterium album]